MNTTTDSATETTQSLIEFGHAVFGVLYDFAHLPIGAVTVAHPRFARVRPGEAYTLSGVADLAAWARELDRPMTFRRGPLPEIGIRVELCGIPFEFTTPLHSGNVDELAARTGADLSRSREFTAEQISVALDVPAGA